MSTLSRNEIVDLLHLPYGEFRQTVVPKAKTAYSEARGNALTPSAVLLISNYCKHSCLYCVNRAPNSDHKRFRLTPDEIAETAKRGRDAGLKRIFMVSGEDAGFGFDNLIDAVRRVKGQGYFISLAGGANTGERYAQLRDAGVDEYLLKFEMADEAIFNRLNPSTNFAERISSIRDIQNSGMRLASGSIIDYPGQTLEQLADDLLFAKDLDISWALNVPYRPAKGTPLADEGGQPGRLEVNLRQVAILRILMPGININAQQPMIDGGDGVPEEEGTLETLEAGANVLFYRLFPKPIEQGSDAQGNRTSEKNNQLQRMSELSGMPLVF